MPEHTLINWVNRLSATRQTVSHKWMRAVLVILILSCFAPVNTAAQTPAPLSLGTDTASGLNLNLIAPVTTGDGKVYYYLDNDGDGAFDDNRINHNTLDTLLNGGIDTGNTQTLDGHTGNDDARSVIVLGHALVLPTRDELAAFRSDQMSVSPWVGINIFWTATLAGGGMHSRYSLATGSTFNVRDTDNAGVVFQVLTALINPPAAPGNVMLTPGNGQIIVTWTFVPVTDNGGAVISGYTATAGTRERDPPNLRPLTGATATTCTITGLTNSATYSVFVFATNSAGNSAELPRPNRHPSPAPPSDRRPWQRHAHPRR